MILVNLIPRTERRPAIAFRTFARFISRVPVERPGERIDRRIFRWVLCGEHGFGRNWREECPRCGGYVERVANPELAARLEERHGEAEETLIRAVAVRRVGRPELTTSN